MHPATWSLKISAILLFMFQSLGSCSLWWRAEADWTAHLSDTPLWTWPSAECEMCKRRAGACVVEHAPPPALGTPLLCCCFCCVGVCAGKQSSASTNWGLDRQFFGCCVATKRPGLWWWSLTARNVDFTESSWIQTEPLNPAMCLCCSITRQPNSCCNHTRSSIWANSTASCHSTLG